MIPIIYLDKQNVNRLYDEIGNNKLCFEFLRTKNNVVVIICTPLVFFITKDTDLVKNIFEDNTKYKLCLNLERKVETLKQYNKSIKIRSTIDVNTISGLLNTPHNDYDSLIERFCSNVNLDEIEDDEKYGIPKQNLYQCYMLFYIFKGFFQEYHKMIDISDDTLNREKKLYNILFG